MLDQMSALEAEEYFCPIKHARKALGAHSRYARFVAYGEATDYAAKLEAFRVGLGDEVAHKGKKPD